MSYYYFTVKIQRIQGLKFFSSAAKLMSILHWCFASDKEHSFGVDIPGAATEKAFRVVRVFSKDKAALARVLAKLEEMGEEAMAVVYDARLENAIFQVPENFSGPWVVCKRVQVPTRKSYSKLPPGMYNRAHKMKRIDEAGLSYFCMQSNTNRHRGRIYIDRIYVDGPTENFNTNTYGLSRGLDPTAIPDLG